MPYHSTGIRRALDHCPAALDFHERGDPELDRRGFETGIAAHAVLEAVGRETEAAGRALELPEIERVANSVADALITEGREFDGKPEPPLHPDSVFAGRELAEDWLAVHPLEPTGSRYEVGLAVNIDWEPVPYDSEEAWLAGILDVVGVEDVLGEEGQARILRVRDYKTSWAAGEHELQTLQRRIQAVLSHLCLPEAKDADLVRLEVAAVRTWRIYSEDVYLRHGGLQKLKRWMRDIGVVVRELGAMLLAGDGARPARPGAGCVGCPYLLRCDDAQLYFGATGLPDDPKERARAYAVAVAQAAALKPMVEKDADGFTVTLEDGSKVGWRSTDSNRVKEDAHRTLAELWAQNAGHPELANVISSALASLGGVSMTQARKMLKSVYPSKEDVPLRQVAEGSVLEPVRRRSWSVWKETS